MQGLNLKKSWFYNKYFNQDSSIFENLWKILKDKYSTGWVTVTLRDVTMDTPATTLYFPLKLCFPNPRLTICKALMELITHSLYVPSQKQRGWCMSFCLTDDFSFNQSSVKEHRKAKIFSDADFIWIIYFAAKLPVFLCKPLIAAL